MVVSVCLTFEVRRDQRQDARPGLAKMYAYHQPGPGGLPLGLASTEGLGLMQPPQAMRVKERIACFVPRVRGAKHAVARFGTCEAECVPIF